jgi:hypothetical protein
MVCWWASQHVQSHSPTLFEHHDIDAMFVDRRIRSRIRLGSRAADVDVSTIPEDPYGRGERHGVLLDSTKG